MSLNPVRLRRRLMTAAFLGGASFFASPDTAFGAYIPITMDLTTAGSSGTSQGALFYQADPHPTGTGYIDPFVRIQMTGTERGYNTDARPVEFDTKDQNQWTHSLNVSTLAQVNINGTNYYKFSLDINEQGSPSGSLLSMDDFRVYLGNSASLTGWNDGFGSNSVKVYDIDAGHQGNKTLDVTVEMDYRLGHGSGSGDLNVYIPVAKFQGYGSEFQWVYLYSSFGNPNNSDAGFEEWWAQKGTSSPPPPPNPVPAPAGALLGLIGLGSCLLGRAFRRRVSGEVKSEQA